MSDTAPLPKAKAAALVAVAAPLLTSIYLVANQRPLGTPRQLPWTPIDEVVPFVPETVWLYFTDYVLMGVAFILAPNVGEAWRLARAMVATVLVGAAVHWLWPTTFPRERFPLQGEGLTASVFTWMRSVDAPTSCLPSLHVACTCLAALSLRHAPTLRAVALLWAGAIAVSTLTTKQHYALDVLAGAALACACWWAFTRR